MLVTPNLGELELIEKMIKDALDVDEGYELKLFKSDTTPDKDTVAADFTEADFTDYTSKTLTRAGWDAATTIADKASISYGTQQSWTCGATGNTVYGYWIEGATSGVCLWAERFATSRTLAEGDQLNLTPVLTLNSESDT